VKDEEIAGLEAECRGLVAIGKQITVTSVAVGLSVIMDREIDLENAILAAQIFGFGYFGAGGRTRTGIGGRLLGAKGEGCGVADCQQAEKCQGPAQERAAKFFGRTNAKLQPGPQFPPRLRRAAIRRMQNVEDIAGLLRGHDGGMKQWGKFGDRDGL